MTTYLIADDCTGELTGGPYTAGDTSVTIESNGTGTFPTPVGDQAFFLIINPGTTGSLSSTEIRKVTVNDSLTFTIDALANDHSAGESVALVVTADVLNGLSGGVPNLDLSWNSVGPNPTEALAGLTWDTSVGGYAQIVVPNATTDLGRDMPCVVVVDGSGAVQGAVALVPSGGVGAVMAFGGSPSTPLPIITKGLALESSSGSPGNTVSGINAVAGMLRTDGVGGFWLCITSYNPVGPVDAVWLNIKGAPAGGTTGFPLVADGSGNPTWGGGLAAVEPGGSLNIVGSVAGHCEISVPTMHQTSLADLLLTFYGWQDAGQTFTLSDFTFRFANNSDASDPLIVVQLLGGTALDTIPAITDGGDILTLAAQSSGPVSALYRITGMAA